jgi:hypothetical protein
MRHRNKKKWSYLKESNYHEDKRVAAECPLSAVCARVVESKWSSPFLNLQKHWGNQVWLKVTVVCYHERVREGQPFVDHQIAVLLRNRIKELYCSIVFG